MRLLFWLLNLDPTEWGGAKRSRPPFKGGVPGSRARRNKLMKLMFFSADRAEVELVRKEFIYADIPCEVRVGSVGKGIFSSPCDWELWIHNEEDSHRALMLCVELGLGFAKRRAA
jgi:hypothetical protein